MSVIAVTSTVVLLAHQGGWDEILLVGGPILVIMFLLRLAKRRVDRVAAAADTQPPLRRDSDGPTHPQRDTSAD